MAWLSGWKYRIKLTTDSTKIDNDLNWFPYTCFLKAGNGDTTKVFDRINENKYKIAIADSNGQQYYVEIEEWDTANKIGVLHFGKSGDTLTSANDKDIYLYYDNTHIDNTDYVSADGNPTEVWDTRYILVYHFNQDPSATAPQIKDSTSNRNGGTAYNLDTSDLVESSVGKAISCNGSTQYIDTGLTLHSFSKFTVLLLVKTTENNSSDTFWQRPTLFGKNSGGTGSGDFAAVTDNGYIGYWQGLKSSTDHTYLSSDTQINDNNPHLVCFENTGSNVNFYLEDSLLDSSPSDISPDDTETITIAVRNDASGVNKDGGDTWHSGIYSEFRVLNDSLANGELKAITYSLRDNLFTYGAEEIFYYSISGTLYDKNGDVMTAACSVFAIDKDTGDLLGSTTSNTDGTFTIDVAVDSGTKVLFVTEYEGTYNGDTDIAGAWLDTVQ